MEICFGPVTVRVLMIDISKGRVIKFRVVRDPVC